MAIVYLFVAIIFGFIGLAVGGNRGRTGAGFALGFFLGLIGIIILMVMEPLPGSPVAEQRAQAYRGRPS